ncbi:MAG TPA: 50S ribosomal protein L15 [Kiritimatiellia bacterium]|jgi:large subunit ribosomal protein L15
MNLHTLTNKHGARRSAKRVGCGESSGHGKTSCRGTKGQMSRSGHKRKPAFEGGQMRMIRRIPKRGFNHPSKLVYAPVNLADLGRFENGSEVDAAALEAAGLVRGTAEAIKILGDGAIERKLTVKVQAFSASARSKIEAAGGTCVVVE